MNVKQKFSVLENMTFQIPENVNKTLYQDCIAKYSRANAEGYFPVGTYCHYIFDFSLDRMVDISDDVLEILGVCKEEILSNSMNTIFSELFSAEHLYSVVNFGKIFYDYMLQGRGDNIFINMEVNIITRNNVHKRVQLQFRPVLYDEAGKPVLTEGYISDITHVKKEGAPVLSLIKNGKLQACYTGTYEDFVKSKKISLTKKEIELLRWRSQGKKINEIALLVNMKPSTVFSYFRDIKRKTEMESNALIKLLFEKGLLTISPAAVYAAADISALIA